jgi:hypothetical protein
VNVENFPQEVPKTFLESDTFMYFSHTNGTLEVSWTAQSGKNYILLASTNNNLSWFIALSAYATNATMVYTNSATPPYPVFLLLDEII